MGTVFKTIQKVKGEVLAVELQMPESLWNADVEITVKASPKKRSKKSVENTKRYFSAQKFKGIAKNTTYTTNRYDVYEQ